MKMNDLHNRYIYSNYAPPYFCGKSDFLCI